MIPEVAAVIAAAEAYVDSDSSVDQHNALFDAVTALRKRQQRPASPRTEETSRTWGEVVDGDEILSVKTGRWYEVTGTVLLDDGVTVKVNIRQAPHKPILRPASDPVMVKRGITGDAVDLFQVLWSAQTAPNPPKEIEQEAPDEL